MTNILLLIITIASVVLVVVLIYVLLELRQATTKLKDLVSTSEASLRPALEELPGTVRTIRHVAENIATVTDDVKILSGSIRDIGQNIRNTTAYIEEIAASSSLRVSGVKAGLRAGLHVLANGLLTKQRK